MEAIELKKRKAVNRIVEFPDKVSPFSRSQKQSELTNITNYNYNEQDNFVFQAPRDS